jgi:hypothetical protein
MKTYKVTVDSPELPPRYEFDVEARVTAEAEVKGAEHALAAVGDDLAPSLRRLSEEDRVVGLAYFAEAVEQ